MRRIGGFGQIGGGRGGGGGGGGHGDWVDERHGRSLCA